MALTFSLVIGCTTWGVNASDDTAKIDTKLSLYMETMSAADTAPILVWLTDIDHEDVAIQADMEVFGHAGMTQTLSTLDIDSSTADRALDELQVTNEQIDELIVTKRALSAEKYTQANTEKFHELFPATKRTLFRTVAQEQPEVTYTCMYAPTILMKATKEQIYTLCASPLVDSVYYFEEHPEGNNDCLDIASQITQTKYIRDTLGYKGDGIKIGQLESCRPNITSANFTPSRTFNDGSGKLSSDNHATMVAYIMVGKNGIVPNASLYSTTTDRSGGWMAGIEWLLSQGVNVINISNTLKDYYVQSYGVDALWLDHVAIQHDVHVVIATGNGGYNYLADAAFANNVISVGGLDDKNSLTLSDDTAVSSSSHMTFGRYKPDICAPSVGIATPTPCGTNGGTSFAAPQVAAAVAQLCQQNALFKTRQDLVKSILLVGARHKETVSASGSGNNIAMSRDFGAGMLDAKNARYVANSSRYRASTMTANVTTFTQTFTVSSSDNFTRVSLAWLRNNRVSTSPHQSGSVASSEIAKMTLTVKAPNGTTWTSSAQSGDSVQLVAFVPPQTGTYTITVTRSTELSTNTHFAVSWY